MRNSKLLISLAFLVILSMACTPSQPNAAKPEEKATDTTSSSGKPFSVAIKGFKFVPADLTVKVGDTVVWTNEDSAPHTVESSDKTLKSDELSKGDKYQHTFTKTGVTDYICGIHPSMQGSVTVQ